MAQIRNETEELRLGWVANLFCRATKNCRQAKTTCIVHPVLHFPKGHERIHQMIGGDCRLGLTL